MAGDDPLLPSLSGFSPASVFQSNKVHGRLQVCEMPSPPPPLLTRKPGRCSEPLEKLKQEYEAKGFFDKLLTEKDAWGNPKEQLWAKLFKSECEKWPDQIPQSFLDEQRQRLNDHLTGKAPLPPEQSLKLRADLSTLEDIYRPGPRLEAPISAEEQAWLDRRNLRMGNDLGIALLGPLFGGPGATTRALGGTEEQVATANQLSMIVFDAATAHAAIGKPAAVRGPPLRQTYGLYIGPKRLYNLRPPLSSRHGIRSVRQGGVKKGKNTVAEPGVDMRADVEAINNGQGTRDGNLYTVNGRTYERFDDHLVPHEGPGFHALSRGEFDALGVFNKFGNTTQAMEIATRVAGESGAARALEVWRLGQ